MKQHRQRNGQEGIAMIIVVCIMAVLVMMSLALLLASSVMTQNAGRVKDQEQSRILAVSLADELEKELTVTPSQQEKTQASGTILEFVNSKITSGSWPSGEEQTFSLDSSALNQANELSAQATLSWEEGENGYTVTLRVIGRDDIAIVTNITSVIGKESNVTLRSLNINSVDGLFQGNFTVLVRDTTALNLLTKKIKAVNGVKAVERLNS